MFLKNTKHKKMPGIEEFTAEFFQQASDAWRKNKIVKKDCTYDYKCSLCDRKVHNLERMRCWNHRGSKK